LIRVTIGHRKNIIFLINDTFSLNCQCRKIVSLVTQQNKPDLTDKA